jgi:hypothetical protein
MIKIDELFEKYPQNIIGFRVNKNTKIIDFWLNNAWEVLKPKSGIKINKQKDSETTNLTYYIAYSETHDFNSLFNMVSEIIEHNLDVERKQTLFVNKMNELKNLFVTLSYEELKAIQFETPYSLRSQEALTDVESNEDLPESVVEPTADDTLVNEENVVNEGE